MSRSSKKELTVLKELANSQYTDSLIRTISRVEENTVGLDDSLPPSSLTIEEIRSYIDYFIQRKNKKELGNSP
jgi:hypothetical protein